ncbi:MAG: hypothetical protein Q7U47_04270 [Paludibacter sp.]|nr:hypothetical protein [Paludibacter sp.]
MKKPIFIFYLLIFGLNLASQSQPILQIKYSDNSLRLVEGHDKNQSINAYIIINDSTLAILNANENKILYYSLIDGKLIRTLLLQKSGIDFDYVNDMFFILDYSGIQIINAENGFVEKELPLEIPKNCIFTFEKIKHINNKNYILSGDGSTWELDDTGLKKVLPYSWIFSKNVSGTSIRKNENSFSLKFTDDIVGNVEFNYQLSDIGITSKLATVQIIDINSDNIILDLETTYQNELKRYLLWFKRNGEYISKALIPNIYATLIKNQFFAQRDHCMYVLSANDGLYFYKLNTNINAIKLPDGFTEIIFNKSGTYSFSESEATPNIFSKAPQMNQSVQYGVTRTQVYQNAMNYLNLEWEATEENISNTSKSGISLPSWITVGSQKSLPYYWGGTTDWFDFGDLTKQGKIIGVDCSGFVSNCWEIGRSTTYSLQKSSITSKLGYILDCYQNLNLGDVILSTVIFCVIKNINYLCQKTEI